VGAVAAREELFGEFVSARSRSLLGLAYLLTGNRHAGEDLVQTALVKTYLALGRLRSPDAIESYVRRTMVTTYTSWRRRRWYGETPVETVPDVTDDGTFDATDDRLSLWPHLRLLPPRQRAVVVLRFYEDLSEAQTADLLGCSAGTVKSHAHRALHTLRAVLEPDNTREPAEDGA
jgi:RNA polymerase sigma-70 factor (sigma-E family)